jgi:Protein of unknown function (DUF2842)
MTPQPEPSWRKPVGILALLGLIAAWAFAVGSLSGFIGALPGWVQLPIYIFTGTIWILPLKPLLSWMETGRWRSW